jgi:hypothetical protein
MTLGRVSESLVLCDETENFRDLAWQRRASIAVGRENDARIGIPKWKPRIPADLPKTWELHWAMPGHVLRVAGRLDLES